MDINFIQTHYHLYIEAGILTIRIATIGIIVSLIIGIICSLIKTMKIPVLKTIVSIYIELSRNTPLLIQLFFLYFGLPKLGIVLNSEACGIIGLAFLITQYILIL